MSTITQVNIYRADNEWCYAAFGADGFDHSDTLGVDGNEDAARAEAAEQFPGAQIERVADVAESAGVSVGDRVEAGEGEDHDTGRVQSIDGDMAYVSWDSGVKTPCPLTDLSVIE